MDERWRLSVAGPQAHVRCGALTAAELRLVGRAVRLPAPCLGRHAGPLSVQASPSRSASPGRVALQRFNQAQKDFEARVEFVPQAQAPQKLITSIAAGTPPDVAQVWDNWVREFEGRNRVRTSRRG